MKNLIQAAVVTLFAASTAQAQQAVQWTVSDGGNGHWYQFSPVGSFGSWTEAQEAARDEGGHLATLASPGELGFVETLARCVGCPGLGPSWAIGGIQNRAAPGYAEPAEGWQWVTGEPWSYSPWAPGEPNDSGTGEDFLYLHCNLHGINDGADPTNGCVAAVLEWSADCNNDGIVDYGQCHDGTLPDFNGNNIPDCCERGETCAVGNYPVQWRGEDSGNGHWYQMVITNTPTNWQVAREASKSLGGHLVSITSEQENQLCLTIAANGPSVPGGSVWLGASQKTDAAPYSWETGEPFVWTPGCGFSNTSQTCGLENYLTMTSPWIGCAWNDVAVCWEIPALLVEWESDCNSDGVVDYGQILQGELSDVNVDGVPDICQQPTCVDADIFRDFNVNGADLGILLSQWGPSTPLTVSDINSDGVVDGADLGQLLSFWGPCPN